MDTMLARTPLVTAEDRLNWRGGPGRLVLRRDHADELMSEGDAFVLFAKLYLSHWNCHYTFAASPKAMVRDGVIPAWGRSAKRYRRAIATLVELGFLVKIHHGGRCNGDANLYEFGPKLHD